MIKKSLGYCDHIELKNIESKNKNHVRLKILRSWAMLDR
jgi:hypothetical protein